MESLNLVIATDENGNIFAYHMASPDDAREFLKQARANPELDLGFESIVIYGEAMTAREALRSLADMQGITD